VTKPHQVQTSVVKKSAPAIAPMRPQKGLPRRRPLRHRGNPVRFQDPGDRRSYPPFFSAPRIRV
jgi:hypothetical protein